jgi:Protein of unknown function (DUF2695)
VQEIIMQESITTPSLSDAGDIENRGSNGGKYTVPDASAIPGPGENECLRCYLMRTLTLLGCDGTHRWTLRWRDTRAPRATGLLKELARSGGICCDCEVVFNVWPDYPHSEGLLPCAGVSPGCTDPCDLASTIL